jgi:hypothetical protein
MYLDLERKVLVSINENANGHVHGGEQTSARDAELLRVARRRTGEELRKLATQAATYPQLSAAGPWATIPLVLALGMAPDVLPDNLFPDLLSDSPFNVPTPQNRYVR